jgi:hypothetical protein
MLTGCGEVVSIGGSALVECVDFVYDRDDLLVDVFLCGATQVED